MDYLQLLSKVQPIVDFLNSNLMAPTKVIQTSLSLKVDPLPNTLKTPLNFTTFIAFLFFIIVTYANAFVCNMIGVFYPVMYGLHMFNENPVSTEKMVTLNKYWMLYGSLTVIDTIFGFVLQYIPAYYYVKIIFVYVLIRDDFALTDRMFGILDYQYDQLRELWEKHNITQHIEQKIGDITEMVNNGATIKFSIEPHPVIDQQPPSLPVDTIGDSVEKTD